jgi:hypothetical protein
VLATDKQGVYGIALDATYAYWTNFETGTVQRVPKCGGAPTVLASGLDEPFRIAVGTDAAYVSSPGGLFEVPLAGGAPSMIAPLANYIPSTDLALDTAYLYWIDWDPQAGSAFQILRRALGGGAIMMVAAVQVGAGAAPGSAIAVDDAYVYVGAGSWTESAVLRAPKNGGAATLVALANHVPTGIAVDGTRIYWSDYEYTGEVTTADKTGSGIPVVLASGQETTLGVVLDATNVYWVNQGNTSDGSVATTLKAGGPITVLAQGQAVSERLALDATGVYWTNYKGTVMRVAP